MTTLDVEQLQEQLQVAWSLGGNYAAMPLVPRGWALVLVGHWMTTVSGTTRWGTDYVTARPVDSLPNTVQVIDGSDQPCPIAFVNR